MKNGNTKFLIVILLLLTVVIAIFITGAEIRIKREIRAVCTQNQQ